MLEVTLYNGTYVGFFKNFQIYYKRQMPKSIARPKLWHSKTETNGEMVLS
jgi:hypothetical protein